MYIAIGSTLPEACVLNKLSVTVTEKWQGYKLIGKKLFDQIPNADWRKTTWIAPEDAHKAPGTKYKTLLTDDDFADMLHIQVSNSDLKMEK